MKKLLKKGQKIFMTPNDINGALSSDIKKSIGHTIECEINKNDIPFYKVGDTIEMFTVVDDGMLYFKPTVKVVDDLNNLLKVEYDNKIYDLLQRREYSRIELAKEFTLKTDTKNHTCICLDLSAGGMKFSTDAELDCSKDYQIEFTLENKIPIQCYFKPIRINAKKGKSNQKVVSGRFIALKNIDKIAIVQFCFKKQTENTNK